MPKQMVSMVKKPQTELFPDPRFQCLHSRATEPFVNTGRDTVDYELVGHLRSNLVSSGGQLIRSGRVPETPRLTCNSVGC